MIQSLYMSARNTMAGAMVSAARLRRMLDELAAHGGAGASSLYVAPGDSADTYALTESGWAATHIRVRGQCVARRLRAGGASRR